ncbi:YcxB family protein [Streptomyces sp. MBT62]|uniref:YcxB family protein n=1 Tax=Streptomyces sp. MBT62 TaxID=2800410 RepID=UPI001909692E|nr:YcxB family protein [Streptomyces sp. MBT62]MBK3564631.1 YcxB family protein [Streptomyces sp. MBT62]
MTGRVVELEFRPVVEDFAAALRARRSVLPSTRRQRWLLVIGVFCIAMATVTSLNKGESIPVPMIAGACAVVLLVVFMPRIQARQFQRLAQQRGVIRVTVTDVGVTVAGDDSSTSLQWTVQPRYRETADGFYMFSPEKNAANFTMLPKRGLRDPADADRLREILDAHLSRV